MRVLITITNILIFIFKLSSTSANYNSFSKSKATSFLKTKTENILQTEWNHEVQFASCLTSLNQWDKIQTTMKNKELSDCVDSCVEEDSNEDWKDNNYEELREDYLDKESDKCPRYPCSKCLASLPLSTKKTKWRQWQQRCRAKGTSEDC